MEHLLQISNSLATRRHHLQLAVISKETRGQIAELIATVALGEPFSIVAGSEWLPLYDVARHLSYRTNEFKAVMDRVHLARAFTCYQLLDILNHTPTIREPLMVLNFLHPFYEDSVPTDVKLRVLDACVRRLENLSYIRPIGVIVQHMEGEGYEDYYPVIARVADTILSLKVTEKEPVVQLRMF